MKKNRIAILVFLLALFLLPSGVNANTNTLPSANAGSDQTVECTGSTDTLVTLDGSGSSDPDGDALTYSWTWIGGSAFGVNPTIQLPLGFYTITLVVNDGMFDSDPDTVDIDVRDTTPPEIEVIVSPDTLWPPSHKMVDITATVTVDDNCDPDPDIVLVSITMNEEEESNTFDANYDSTTGDGHTYIDIQDADIGTEDYEFSLRAERAGDGDGRIYIIIYMATDASGNSGVGSAAVLVPHHK